MVWVIETIDRMSRRLGRDVIFLRFTEGVNKTTLKKNVKEAKVWLDDNSIGWRMTGDFDPHFIWIEGTPSCIYLDVKPRSRKIPLIRKKFAGQDGSPRIGGLLFSRITFTQAMEHSHRDDPDFWD
jgi:hypothetical protein